ncbi:MAG: hypothetical protein FWF76_03460 [Oscillospiraceae bacterium]|nr:hypothetical protein [Oscillospiraceae bacterium]
MRFSLISAIIPSPNTLCVTATPTLTSDKSTVIAGAVLSTISVYHRVYFGAWREKLHLLVLRLVV